MLNRSLPWLTDQSITFLEGFVKNIVNNPKILEFGSGSSTLFFANKSSEIVSFEHDPQWHKHVSKY